MFVRLYPFVQFVFWPVSWMYSGWSFRSLLARTGAVRRSFPPPEACRSRYLACRRVAEGVGPAKWWSHEDYRQSRRPSSSLGALLPSDSSLTRRPGWVQKRRFGCPLTNPAQKQPLPLTFPRPLLLFRARPNLQPPFPWMSVSQAPGIVSQGAGPPDMIQLFRRKMDGCWTFCGSGSCFCHRLVAADSCFHNFPPVTDRKKTTIFLPINDVLNSNDTQWSFLACLASMRRWVPQEWIPTCWELGKFSGEARKSENADYKVAKKERISKTWEQPLILTGSDRTTSIAIQ